MACGVRSCHNRPDRREASGETRRPNAGTHSGHCVQVVGCHTRPNPCPQYQALCHDLVLKAPRVYLASSGACPKEQARKQSMAYTERLSVAKTRQDVPRPRHAVLGTLPWHSAYGGMFAQRAPARYLCIKYRNRWIMVKKKKDARRVRTQGSQLTMHPSLLSRHHFRPYPRALGTSGLMQDAPPPTQD